MKDRASILSKLGIEQLLPMQEAALEIIQQKPEVVLLSPTGTGKTLAFLLPLLEGIDPGLEEVQLLIVVPSRELAIQIHTVVRDMGTGHKANTVYGGSLFSKDKTRLKHRPAILIGTPGRIADHFRRHTFPVDNIQALVLDEFDKSLEVGFAAEMKEILHALTGLRKKVLTSATKRIEIPEFVGLRKPEILDYTDVPIDALEIKVVPANSPDKLDALVALLSQLHGQPGIIFCNLKETISTVSDHLWKHKIHHGIFYGGMEQKDRERALIKFRNGTHTLLLATDLAARGIDVPEISFIAHFQLPLKKEEFIHRNGRTARMNSAGTAYVLKYRTESLPDFIGNPPVEPMEPAPAPPPPVWKTVMISGGRGDKISKGDIAGLFFKQGKLKKDQLGVIELKVDCAFAAVDAAAAEKLISMVNNTRLKTKKVRVTEV